MAANSRRNSPIAKFNTSGDQVPGAADGGVFCCACKPQRSASVRPADKQETLAAAKFGEIPMSSSDRLPRQKRKTLCVLPFDSVQLPKSFRERRAKEEQGCSAVCSSTKRLERDAGRTEAGINR